MTTVAEARDSIIQSFYDAWSADSQSEDIKVFYPGKDEDESEKSADKSWARISIKHFDSGFSKNSLVDSEGKKNYQRDGVVIVNIFTPIGDGLGLDAHLASVVMGAYEGKSTPNGVWFRNVRFNEIGTHRSWNQTNVKANFNYSEHK